MQTKFGPEVGNCFEACLSSITHLPIEPIPSYKGEGWFDKCNKYLAKHGLVLVMYGPKIFEVYKNLADLYCIAGGKSPRFNCNHAVVFRKGKMVHDPHPDNTGISDIQDYTFVFKLDPIIRQEGKA
jgi:hypothetical protein